MVNAMTHVWRSESILICYHLKCTDGIKVVRLGNKDFYLFSHLTHQHTLELEQTVVARACYPGTGRLKQEDCEHKTNLSYIVRSF